MSRYRAGWALALAVVVVTAFTACGENADTPATGSSGSAEATGSDVARQPGSASAPPSSVASGTGSAPTSGGESVDPQAYLGATGIYYFVSPSGNLLCGIDPTASVGYFAGCHAKSLVTNLPKCDNPDSNGPWAAITQDGDAEVGCQNEGVFVDEKPKTLEYGQVLIVGDVSCASMETGVTCTRGGSGFTASKDAFDTVG